MPSGRKLPNFTSHLPPGPGHRKNFLAPVTSNSHNFTFCNPPTPLTQQSYLPMHWVFNCPMVGRWRRSAGFAIARGAVAPLLTEPRRYFQKRDHVFQEALWSEPGAATHTVSPALAVQILNPASMGRMVITINSNRLQLSKQSDGAFRSGRKFGWKRWDTKRVGGLMQHDSQSRCHPNFKVAASTPEGCKVKFSAAA